MKFRASLAAAMVALFALAVSADNPAAVKAGLQKEINAYVAAMKKKDYAAVEKVIKANFAPEFKETDLAGTSRDRTQTLGIIKQQMAGLKSISKMTYTIKTLKLNGNKATGTEHMLLEATIAAGEGTSKVKVDSEWASTYVKRGSKWLYLASKATKQKIWMDGKPIN